MHDAPHVVTLGESMLRVSAQRVGPLRHSATAEIGIGGAESNVAIGVSRLGLRAAWISRLGHDSAGDVITRELSAEGVTVHAQRDATAPTGLMLHERRTPATTRVTYYRAASAASALCPDDIDAELIQHAQLLHITGITPALSDSARAATLTATRIARDAGVKVSFDLNYRSSLWSADRARAAYTEILPNVDLVFAGEDEAEIVTGHLDDADSYARALLDHGASISVIKQGAQGATARSASDAVQAGAIRVPVVDTVGAGDSFVAGFLASHLRGQNLATCVATAVRTGAFVCMSHGDWEGAPYLHELALLDQDDPVTR